MSATDFKEKLQRYAAAVALASSESVIAQVADQSEALKAELHAAIDSLFADLNEADRRAGAAERVNSALSASIEKNRQWLDAAKQEAGFDVNDSFDVVWQTVLAKAMRNRRAADVSFTRDDTSQ